MLTRARTVNSFLAIFILGIVIAGHAAAQNSVGLRILCDGEARNSHITINDRYMGQCPMDLELPAGAINLRAVKEVDSFQERVFVDSFNMVSGARRVSVELGPPTLNARGRERRDLEERRKQAALAEHNAIVNNIRNAYETDRAKHLLLEVQVVNHSSSPACRSNNRYRPYLSPDGRFLAVGVCVGNELVPSLQIWDIASKRHLTSLSGRDWQGEPYFTRNSNELIVIVTSSTKVNYRDNYANTFIWISKSNSWHKSIYSPFFSKVGMSSGEQASDSPSGRYLVYRYEPGSIFFFDREANAKREIGIPETLGALRLLVDDSGVVFFEAFNSNGSTRNLYKVSAGESKPVVMDSVKGDSIFAHVDGVPYLVSRASADSYIYNLYSGQKFAANIQNGELLLSNGKMLHSGSIIHSSRSGGRWDFSSLNLIGGKVDILKFSARCSNSDYYWSLVHYLNDGVYCFSGTRLMFVNPKDAPLEPKQVFQLSPDPDTSDFRDDNGRDIYHTSRVVNFAVDNFSAPSMLAFSRMQFDASNRDRHRSASVEVWNLKDSGYFISPGQNALNASQ